MICFSITEKVGSQDAGYREARAPSDCVGRGHLPGSVQRGDPGWYVRVPTQLRMLPKCL